MPRAGIRFMGELAAESICWKAEHCVAIRFADWRCVGYRRDFDPTPILSAPGSPPIEKYQGRIYDP